MAVDLALAKQHLRVDDDAEDVLISAYLGAAKAWVEAFTGKKLVRGSVEQPAASFGSYVPLVWGPNPEGASVSYVDASSQPQTLADAGMSGGCLYAPIAGWPNIAPNTSIVITYTAGFDETPADLDAAVLLLTGDLYTNREAVSATLAVTMAVQSLCSPYRSVLV